MARTPVGIIPEDVTRSVTVSDDQRRTVAMAASLLLDYPRDDHGEKIAAVDTLRLFQIVPFAEAIELVAISYALTGFAVGVVGSLLSIRKFLKV